MSGEIARKTLISALIAVLHLPLVYQALIVYRQLVPGQSIGDLPPTSLLVLLLLLVMPYAVLAVFGVSWNPGRARLNEPLN